MRLPYRFVGSFKGVLFILAVGFILAVMVYTERLVSELRQTSHQMLTLKVERLKELFEKGDDAALDRYLAEMSSKDFPLIIGDSAGAPISWSGIPELEKLPDPQAKLLAAGYQQEWLGQGNEPVALDVPEHHLKFYYYYGDSPQIRRLQVLPWIEFAIVSSLVLIGYLGFVSIKKSEERSVWVGMARETAHQLGTPLTSLYGWIELLGEHPADPETRAEIERDLERLRIVAERFNQIGSTAQLAPKPIAPIAAEAAAYIRRRLPSSSGSQIDIEVDIPDSATACLNPTLFSWVLENLLKNAGEAMKGKSGLIRVAGIIKGKQVVIDVVDEGTGIPRRLWKDVFRPGYTTKSRGWGLGLSLTRRIVEDLHRGRIFVADSVVDKGTTIRIILPSV